MTVRKNFNFDNKTAKHLEEMAEIERTSQTQIIQDAIEERYSRISAKRKLEVLDEIKDSFHGLLTDVDAKSARVEHAMEKYGK